MPKPEDSRLWRFLTLLYRMLRMYCVWYEEEKEKEQA